MVRKEYPERSVELRTARVGGGNPAALFALKRLLLASRIFSAQNLLQVSTIPVQHAHQKVSQSVELSAAYTQNSAERTGWKAKVFGVLAKVEIEIGRLFRHDADAPKLLVAVQEHQFSAYSQEELAKRYPDGVYLFIPDVDPKESAVAVMRDKGITPIVWNEDAQKRLADQNFNPLLIAPILPYAYHHDGLAGKEKKVPVEDYILIKTSGSGMPDIYAENLQMACERWSQPYQIWYPDRYYDSADRQFHPILGTFEDQVSSFYAHLLTHPPKILISYPSEMVQVASMMPRTKFVTLPPRGGHELANLQWATEKGIVSAQINAQDPNQVEESINSILELPPRSFAAELGLGSESLVAALEKVHKERHKPQRE